MSFTFNELWKNFPRDNEKVFVRAKCQNKQPAYTKPFENYCAVYLSEALIKSGINTSNA